MSLVSNFIGGISSIGVGTQNSIQNFDLSDTTFSDLLEKQIEVKPKEETIFASLGMPAGMQIENADFAENVTNKDLVQQINSTEKKETLDNNVTTSEAITFFSSLLDNPAIGDNNSGLFDFAKKQASNFYNKYSRSVVTDIKEFVEDIQSIN